MLVRFARIGFVALLLGSTLATATMAQSRPRIVNGVLTSAFPQTGALLQGSSADTAGAWCSGTLIGCRTFLTAQHCVEGMGPSDFKVFLQHGGIYNVASITRAPGYKFPVADIAVLTLTEPVTGIRPARINTIGDPPFGSAGIIAGFGRTGGDNEDYGLKRMGSVVTASCQGASNNSSVCWNFDQTIGPAGTDSNTCNADSGGPLFITLNGEQVLAGVTSGGSSTDCLPTDFSYDADVHFYRSFIANAAGADLDSQSCGDISQVGDGDTTVHGFSGQVSALSPDAVHSFTVPAQTARLRVVLNGVDDGTADFDLYLRAGSPPTEDIFDCAREGTNQFAACEVEQPADVTWYALVHRYRGSGSYQLTATILSPGCSEPSNAGQPCDDGNPCTGDDICGAGSCQGSVLEDGTECGAGNLCTGPLTCGSGVCSFTSAPRTNCMHSTDDKGAFITLRADPLQVRDKLQWKWMRGQATFDFGDPTVDTDYALCLYDQNAGSDQLIMTHRLPAGFGWSASASGFRYSDRAMVQDGIRAVKLKYGQDGRASIVVSGKGSELRMTELPLQQDPRVTVQLVNSEDKCWEGRFDLNIDNDDGSFKAKGN